VKIQIFFALAVVVGATAPDAIAAPPAETIMERMDIQVGDYLIQTVDNGGGSGGWHKRLLRISKDGQPVWTIRPETVPVVDYDCVSLCDMKDPEHRTECPGRCPPHLDAMDFDPVEKILYFGAVQPNGSIPDVVIFAADVDSRKLTRLGLAGNIINSHLSPSYRYLAFVAAIHSGGPDGGSRHVGVFDTKEKTMVAWSGNKGYRLNQDIDAKNIIGCPTIASCMSKKFGRQRSLGTICPQQFFMNVSST